MFVTTREESDTIFVLKMFFFSADNFLLVRYCFAKVFLRKKKPLFWGEFWMFFNYDCFLWTYGGWYNAKMANLEQLTRDQFQINWSRRIVTIATLPRAKSIVLCIKWRVVDNSKQSQKIYNLEVPSIFFCKIHFFFNIHTLQKTIGKFKDSLW